MIDGAGNVSPALMELENSDGFCTAPDLLNVLHIRVENNMRHKHTHYCKSQKHQCRFFYPFDLCENTHMDPRTGILKFKRLQEEDRLVVPYNPWMLMLFDCHVNVQVCCSRSCIGYLYKYVFKGVDKAEIAFSRIDAEHPYGSDENELDHFLNGRYLSAGEAAWRVMGFPMYAISSTVDAIECHLPGDSKKDGGSSPLEKYLDRPEGSEFDSLTYEQFSTRYITSLKQWDSGEGLRCTLRADHMPTNSQQSPFFFVKRRRHIDAIYIRVNQVPHKFSEKFALRQLLLHEPTRNLHNLKLGYHSFMDAAVAKGFLEHGQEGILAFEEAAKMHHTGQELRNMLLHLILDGEQFLSILYDESGEWVTNNVNSLTMDWMQNGAGLMKRCYTLLDWLHESLERISGCDAAKQYGLPARPGQPDIDNNDTESQMAMAIEKELRKWNQDFEEEKYNLLLSEVKKQPQQKKFVETVKESLDNPNSRVEWHFLGGPAGTGKTFVAQCLLSYVRMGGQLGSRANRSSRAQGKVAKVCGATWLAAGNFDDGTSVHNLFGLGIDNAHDQRGCKLSKSKEWLLSKTNLIILDELPFLNKHTFESVHDCLEQIKTAEDAEPCVVIACGDFRQLAPIVSGRNCNNSFTAFSECVLSSPKWRKVKKHCFTTLIRQRSDPEYGEQVQNIGDGINNCRAFPLNSLEHSAMLEKLYGMEKPEHHLDAMKKSEIVTLPFHTFNNSEESFIKSVYYDIGTDETCLQSQRAILVSTNAQRNAWNLKIQSLRDHTPTVSLVAENVLKEGDLSQDAIDAFSNNNIPPSVLNLKIGDLLLVTAITAIESKGICNNSRVRLLAISENGKVLKVCKIDSDQQYFLPRRWFRDIPISRQGCFDRLQFPVDLSYAMTVHKCQGQTMMAIGIDASVPFFAHGQTYVALSRVQGRGDLFVFHPTCEGPVHLLNIVYPNFLITDLGKRSMASRDVRPQSDMLDIRRVRPRPVELDISFR